MPLSPDALPIATPYDHTEDPPGSIDPLGTLGHAERLADILFLGMTARMWRPRLLTFAVLSAAIADRVVHLMGDRDDLRLAARLAFERLFVSALVRAVRRDPTEYSPAATRVPGRRLAEAALATDEPLTHNNFLKGQAVNGPFGVMARLARNLQLVDDDGHVGRNGAELLIGWAEEEGLCGLLDEEARDERPGAIFSRDMAKVVAASIGKREWPSRGNRLWEDFSAHLRPDKIGRKEQQVVVRLLDTDSVRQRMLELLIRREAVSTYRQNRGLRGELERAVLLRGVKPLLEPNSVDRAIETAISTIEAYEVAAALLQQTFDALVWGIKRHGGRASAETITADPRVAKLIARCLRALPRRVATLDRCIAMMRNHPSLDVPALTGNLHDLRDQARAASTSADAIVEVILSRHEAVQREKRKSVWIDRGRQWTLMPGPRIEGDEPPTYEERYLHPFRVQNAYSFLTDLGKLRGVVIDGGED